MPNPKPTTRIHAWTGWHSIHNTLKFSNSAVHAFITFSFIGDLADPFLYLQYLRFLYWVKKGAGALREGEWCGQES